MSNQRRVLIRSNNAQYDRPRSPSRRVRGQGQAADRTSVIRRFPKRARLRQLAWKLSRLHRNGKTCRTDRRRRRPCRAAARTHAQLRGSATMDDDGVRAPPGTVVPPLNFAMVSPGIYRSGYPRPVNLEFLKTLRLKTIIYLCLEDYSESNREFCKKEDVTLLQYGMSGNKEPFVDIPESVMRKALEVLLDVRRHPVLIHCNKGKHRTGCLVGCLRKVQRWSLTSIFDEYRRYAGTKTRDLDQQFIELFQTNLVRYHVNYKPSWL